jgi:nitroreductase/NAD-dependent dihydropyrimidine dehydrogenase PreA subunit
MEDRQMAITIDQDRCNACGICGDVCPRHIPETIDSGIETVTVISSDRIGLCMACGHCSAACPQKAIEVKRLENEPFGPAEKLEMDDTRLLSFLKHRRSIRRYKNKPVPRAEIDRIIEAVHSSPTGTGGMTTGVIVIDNPKILARLSDLVYEMYEGLEKNLKNPVARFFIKRRAGQKNFRTLQDFVMPGMHWYIRWYREGRSNEIIRNCPALMLFHSPVFEPVAAENCLLAAFHAILMAETLGIGTCINDLVPPACQRMPQIRDLLNLPEDREVYACITMGYPKYQFKRIPPRQLAEVNYL